MKKTASSNEDREELRERFHLMLNTRLETDFEFRDLFIDAYKAMRKGDQAKMKQLFVQHAANVTQAPNLAPEIPEPPREDPDPFGPGQPASTSVGQGGKLLNTSPPKPPEQKPLRMSKTAAVDAWFEKNASAFMSEAQRRFPELLKVATSDTQKTPVERTTKLKGTGKSPVQSPISGGSA